jgi:hypothetical protein
MSTELYTAPIIQDRTRCESPVPHTRVSGVFEGTDVEFTVYLPPADAWQGRFFQYTYPMPIPGVWEGAAATDRAVGFALRHGGYAVQAGSSSSTVLGHAHAAAAAQLAKEVATEFYGCPGRRIHGYLYGPSGGSFQTIGAMELTQGVWDGFVPMVMGTPVSIPGDFFIRAMARMVLSDKAEQIADAVRPGGSGAPFDGLDEAESTMLQEMLDYGTPLCAWMSPQYLLSQVDLEGAPVADPLMGMGDVIRQMDPTYVEDFWREDGYLGTEPSALGDRVRAALSEAGDDEENRWAVALPSYYRHQVPSSAPDMVGFDQLRTADGAPRYPQRPVEVGAVLQRQTTGGATYSGAFSGKVVVVDALGDSDALPWHADWYAGRVRRRLGAEADDRLRVYFQESSDHNEQHVTGYRATHLVDYIGAVEQALVDLAAWVEDGVAAPASTKYVVHRAQIEVPQDATDRLGIQPVGRLSLVQGPQGEVAFHLDAQAPVGQIVEIAWDFDGTGQYEALDFGAPSARVVTSQTRALPSGTRFVAARITAHRSGDPAAEHCRVQNLVRARVVTP